jgi:hypothetical protein
MLLELLQEISMKYWKAIRHAHMEYTSSFLLYFKHIKAEYSSATTSWGGMRLRPLGTSPTNWPTVPAQDDR